MYLTTTLVPVDIVGSRSTVVDGPELDDLTLTRFRVVEVDVQGQYFVRRRSPETKIKKLNRPV